MANKRDTNDASSAIPAEATGQGVALATTTDAAVAQAQAADMLSSAIDMAGAGMEKIGVRETAIPTLRVLQSNSHEVGVGDPKFVEGAVQGDFFAITPDGPKVFKGSVGLEVYVAQWDKAWIEWVPINKGGGFVKRHATEELALTERKAKDNEIQETWEYYLIVVDPNTSDFFPVLFGCSSSKLTPGRHWNNALKGLRAKNPATGQLFVPPAWYHRFKIVTKRVTNKQGQTYFNFESSKGDVIDRPEIFEAAKGLREAVLGGALEAYKDAAIDAVELTDADIPDEF